MDKLLDQFSFGLFFWQALLFIGLLLLLRKFAWKPILGAVNEREQKISESLEQAVYRAPHNAGEPDIPFVKKGGHCWIQEGAYT